MMSTVRAASVVAVALDRDEWPNTSRCESSPEWLAAVEDHQNWYHQVASNKLSFAIHTAWGFCLHWFR